MTLSLLVAYTEDQEACRAQPVPTGDRAAHPPPYVSSRFASVDNGNPNPRFVRSSIYRLPQSGATFAEFNVPFTLVAQPFARLQRERGECAPPVAWAPDAGPVRCAECGGHMTAFTQFHYSGKHFDCPFCKTKNDVPTDYFAYVDHNGQRLDKLYKPELHLGAFDLMESPAATPNPPLFVFMVDVSEPSVDCQLPANVLRDLPKVLRNLRNNCAPGSRVSVVCYDSYVHFLDLRSKQNPTLCSITDFEDIFVPFIDGLLNTVDETVEALEKLSASATALSDFFFREPVGTPRILGPALEFGLELFRSGGRVGKLLLYAGGRPDKAERGQLAAREQRAGQERSARRPDTTPTSTYYKDLAARFVHAGVGVDLFVASPDVDLPTLADLATETGGDLFRYRDYSQDVHESCLYPDTLNALRPETAFQVEMEFRHNSQFELVTVHGLPQPADRPVSPVALPHLTASPGAQKPAAARLGCMSTSRAVQYELRVPLRHRLDAHSVFQFAVRHTNMAGERRTRVLNLCLASTADQTVFVESVDWGTMACHHVKETVTRLRDLHSAEAAQRHLMRQLVYTLTAVRRRVNDLNTRMLFVPHSMRLYVFAMFAISNNVFLFPKSETSPDSYAFYQRALLQLGVADVISVVVPSMYRVDQKASDASSDEESDTDADESEQETDERPDLNSVRRMPINARMGEYCIYLVHNMFQLFVWVGKDCETAEKYVGPKDQSKHVSLPSLNSAENRRLHWLVAQIRSLGSHQPHINTIWSGGHAERQMTKLLVMDAVAQSNDFQSFVRKVHENVQMMIN